MGAKPLGEIISGAPNSQAVGVPVTEVRGALLRSFKQGRMDLGVNFLIAKGYAGQTTEHGTLGSKSKVVRKATPRKCFDQRPLTFAIGPCGLTCGVPAGRLSPDAGKFFLREGVWRQNDCGSCHGSRRF